MDAGNASGKENEMFTGIIEETGTVDAVAKGAASYQLRIRCRKVLGGPDDPTEIGDSIAVNGICLTVTERTADTFTADVMPETVRRTSLSEAAPGSKVDLERAMAANGRFGGHIVSGHIDGTGKITRRYSEGNAVWFEIRADRSVTGLIVEKGSIAIDGISLTVAAVSGDTFQVSIIPHTMEETILTDKDAGAVVNLETDVIGKYIQKLMQEPPENGGRPESGKDADDGELLSLLY